MVRKVTIVVAAVLGAICAGQAAAGAHPLLVTAAPAPGSLLPGSPSTLTLAFSETSVVQGSAVTLEGPRGQRVALGRLSSTGGAQQLESRLPNKLAPGVYRVRWAALGQDGHTVSGEFAFAVAEANGSPPPGASGLGAVGDGRGGSAAGEGLPGVVVRWIGILAAALLWGGVLLAALARRSPKILIERTPVLSRALRAALGLALFSALLGLLQQAGAGAAGGVNLGLLTDSGTGISALARSAVALAGSATLVALVTLARRRGSAWEPRVLAVTGLLLLVGYGLSGHVLAQGNLGAALIMAIHVVAAGAWAGGLLALVLLAGTDALTLPQGARAFAPLALATLGAAAVTGVISAVREVGHWYFLWWTPYGRLVLVKALVVAVAALAGAAVLWRTRPRPDRPAAPRGRRVTLALEGGLALSLVAVATVLSGLAQGRGQPLPAQRGNLLPGPALASVVLPHGIAPVTLAPARPGTNTLVVTPPTGAHSVLVRLACGCDVRPVITRLSPAPGASGNFSAQVPVPTAGNWNAYVTVDGAQAPTPVALTVGVPSAAGAPVRNVLAVADLSGPGGARCRNYLTGLELALGRLNGSGGIDGANKVALLAYDDAGVPAQGLSAVASALAGPSDGRPIALTPCGSGAEAAQVRAANLGIPVIAGDPATGAVAGPEIFRVAGDPYADGIALAQAIGAEVLPVSVRGVRTVEVVSVADAQGQRRLEGLRAGLAALPAHPRVVSASASRFTRAGPAQLRGLLDRRHTAALVLDGTDAQAPALAAALRRLPTRAKSFGSAPVLASERLLSESFIQQAGDAGRLGVIQGTSTVAVDSRDGLTLSQALPTLFPGERASLEGLRGYVAGLALDHGLAGGSAAASIVAQLTRPLPFTDAIPEPWRADAPGAGTQRLGVLEPTFLSSTLVPTSQGGEAYSGQYFANGAWMRPSSALFGPSLRTPVVPLGTL
jgi:methionine-rich copper-binding protein CopC/putative copper export protein/ABC-type branched-subunit amino acid transport system substrate-binding protein